MHQSWETPINQYCSAYSSADPPYLQELINYTWKTMVNPRMLSGHLQGRLLAMISQWLRPTNVLEIGTFTGYSALCLAEGLATDGHLVTVEANGEYAFKAESFIAKTPLAAQISVIHREGLDYIKELTPETLDLVFIDADKHNYIAYFEALKDKIRIGGTMLCDNVLWSEKVIDETLRVTDADTKRMHLFNETIKNQQNWKILMLPLRDGLGIYRKLAPDFV